MSHEELSLQAKKANQCRLAILLPITMFFLVLSRLMYGVDLSDESFYAVSAKVILDWGGLFVMNANISQFSSALLIPLLCIWNAVFPNAEALILWLRFCFLIFLVICSFCIYTHAIKSSTRVEALLLSALPLAWIPFGLPALSYNTMGQGFTLCGLAAFSCDNRTAPIERLLRALPFGLAAVAYPTLTVAIGVFIVLSLFLSDEQSHRKQSLYTILALVLVGLTFALLLSIEGFSNIKVALESFSSMSKGNPMKHFLLQDQLLKNFFPFLSATSLVLGLLVSKQPGRISLVSMYAFLVVLLTVALLPAKAMFLPSHTIITLLGIFFIPIVLLNHSERFIKFVFLSAWIAGLSAVASSQNGLMNFCIGIFPGLCIMLCYLSRFGRLDIFNANLFRTVVVILLCYFSITSIYGDSSVENNTTVAGGSFKFIRTTSDKNKLIEGLRTDLSAFEKSRKTLYVIGPPGCYLCSKLKPLDLRVFHLSGEIFERGRPLLDKFYAKHGKPDVILYVPVPYFGEQNSLDKDLLKSGYRPSVQKLSYTIFEKI